MSEPVLEMLTVACESTGTELSKPTLKLWDSELARYPEGQVLRALRKCCLELRGRLTLADVVARLDDGRPGVEEAWALLSPCMNNEQISVCWTDEMREAYGVAALLADDPVAARMAFKEKYVALVNDARAAKVPRHWSVSFGYDVGGRTAALQLAVARNQVSQSSTTTLLPLRDESEIEMNFVNIGVWPGGKP